MEVIGVGLLITLIWKLTDTLKMLVGGDRAGAGTQLIVWVTAIVVAFLAANADLTEALPLIGGRPLGSLNAASLILAGLLIGSGASSTVDIKQALDGSDSAAKPPLFSRLARSGPQTP